jgi:hypothetical protein
VGCLLANFGGYPVNFVRNDDILIDIESGLPQTEYDTGARLIDPKPLKT